MNIGIDLRPLAPGASGGIAPHVKGVITAMIQDHPETQFHAFCTIFSRSLVDIAAPNLTAYTFPTFDFYRQLDAIAAERRLDALFRSFPMPDGPAFPWARQVVIVPDLQHETLPECFAPDILRGRRKAFNAALANAGAIGTSTEYGRRTIVEHPWTRCRDVFLMPPALPPDQHQVASADLTAHELARIPDGPFFLFPANLWPHKNHRALFAALRRVRQQRADVQLILSGHPNGWDALHRDFADLPVRHLGFVRPAMLRFLYQRAVALCFFSRYEGFGMPILEAFDAGCPVLCSNGTSMPEVAGDAALTADPTNDAAIARLMLQVLDDPQRRQDLIDRGRARPALWDWHVSGKCLHDACLRVARADRPSIVITDPPRVSIVTPSFNQGRYLQHTIDSVLAQDYPHIEYAVVDGGSTDDSVRLLQSYGGRFPWVSEKDRGQTHAINKGFARATGQFRAYLNSDDLLKPGAVTRAVEHFQRRPHIDMIYGRAEYTDENDALLGMYRTAPYSFEHLMNECMVCQPAAFWTTRIARTVGPLDESLHYAMDYDYWLRIDRAGGIIEHVDDLLACSRLHAQTKTLSMREKIFAEVFEVTRRHGGRARLSYFVGLWHHRAHERRDTLISRLRHVPGLWQNLALWHYHRYNGDWHSPRAAIRDTGARARHWLRNRPAVQHLFSRVGVLAAVAERHKTVRGIFGDNWMAPHAIVTVRRQAPGATVHLRGTSPVNTTLTITACGQILGRESLAAGTEQTVRFRFPGGCRRVEFRFSDHVVDAARRRLSFLLSDTDLFCESDWA